MYRTKKSKLEIDLKEYMHSGEKLISFGSGGSESLVLILKSRNRKNIFVRKILSEKLVSARWDRSGNGSMTPPFKKAILQYKYLKGLPNGVAPYFPKVYKLTERVISDYCNQNKAEKKNFFEVIYDEEFIGGMEVSTFIALYKPPSKVVAQIYVEILRCLKEKIHSQRKKVLTSRTIHEAYFSKIKKRLEISRITAPRVFNKLILGSKYIWINGKKYLNIYPLLKKLETKEFVKILEPSFHGLVMGDTNTENIKITNIKPVLRAMKSGTSFSYDEIGIKFLDPRAIGFDSSGDETVDDYMYDNKPLHNSWANYDAIHGEYFDLSVAKKARLPKISIKYSKDNPYKKSYKDIKHLFKYIMEAGWDVSSPKHMNNDPYWLIRFVFIMGTHFLAMPPFHFSQESDGSLLDDYNHQKRPIALYCEGIKWLNLTLKMLNGKVKTFNGFKLPKVNKVKG